MERREETRKLEPGEPQNRSIHDLKGAKCGGHDVRSSLRASEIMYSAVLRFKSIL